MLKLNERDAKKIMLNDKLEEFIIDFEDKNLNFLMRSFKIQES